MPATDAIDQPMKMKATEAARFWGGSMRPSVAAACGVNSPAEITVTARSATRLQKSGASAESPWPSA